MKEYELFIGPQHVGITGNFMYHLWVDGDTIVKAEAHPGYLHRGFEKLMERRSWLMNVALIPRICVPEPDVNEASYSMAVESLMGWDIPERAKYIRTIVLEMARLSAHLLTIGGYAGAIGLYTIPQWTVGDRDYLLDLFEQLTGGRVYHIFIFPGGVRWDLPDGFLRKMGKVLDYLESRLPFYDKVLFKNEVFFRRAPDIGVIPKDKAIEWGVTGPNLRACGYEYDVRKLDPYAAYPDLDFEIPHYPKFGDFDVLGHGCDCYSRMVVRRLEIEQSIRILRQVIEKIPEGEVSLKRPNPIAWKVPAGYSYARVESSKGEFGYLVISDGGKMPYRVHVRGPSYTHGVNVTETIAKGLNIADFSQTIFSLDVCAPDIER